MPDRPSVVHRPRQRARGAFPFMASASSSTKHDSTSFVFMGRGVLAHHGVRAYRSQLSRHHPMNARPTACVPRVVPPTASRAGGLFLGEGCCRSTGPHLRIAVSSSDECLTNRVCLVWCLVTPTVSRARGFFRCASGGDCWLAVPSSSDECPANRACASCGTTDRVKGRILSW